MNSGTCDPDRMFQLGQEAVLNQDPILARSLFLRGAELGHAKCQFMMYCMGASILISEWNLSSNRWLELSANHGRVHGTKSFRNELLLWSRWLRRRSPERT